MFMFVDSRQTASTAVALAAQQALLLLPAALSHGAV